MHVSFLFAMSLSLIFVCSTIAFPNENSGVTAKELAGNYEIISGEKDGEKIPAERIAGQKVKITEEKIVATDKESKETFSCTYKVESTKTPSVIKMISTVKGHEGTPADGLVMMAGDTVQLIYTLPEGSGLPKKFQTDKGQLMVTMRKLKESE